MCLEIMKRLGLGVVAAGVAGSVTAIMGAAAGAAMMQTTHVGHHDIGEVAKMSAFFAWQLVFNSTAKEEIQLMMISVQ